VHTPYAAPWIYPPLALYGFDLLLRLLRLRVKDATLTAPDNQMTIITVHDAHTGFSAGQHVRLRVFAKGRVVFESHPLTILCAPTKTAVLSPAVVQPGSLVLAARACGDWSRALNDIARSDSSSDPLICEDTPLLNSTDGVPVQVMLDGPYGGASVDLGDSEHVLLLAGGSGVTFALGMLDDILGRIVRHGRKGGERTRRIELAWCIRSFGAMGWVVPHFRAFAEAAKRDSNLELRFTVFVTCLCDPEAVPDIEGLEVTIERPVPGRMLKRFIRNERLVGCGCEVDSSQEEAEKEGFELGSEKGAAGAVSTTADVGVLEKGGEASGEVVTGGVVMCVAGPESLVREAANAAERLSAGEESRMGGLSLHCEVYAM
jgi:ferric-chelate reductase